MTVLLDRTIIPARDKIGSAQFFATILGLDFDRSKIGHVAPVPVNESLTLEFAESSLIDPHHYTFKVGEADFDQVLERIKEDGMPYGSGPRSPDDWRLNHRNGGRGVSFLDPDGHVLEVLTAAGPPAVQPD